MSTPEQVEQRSSVAIEMNAKGEAQVKVKVYDGADPDGIDRIRHLAVQTYKATVSMVREP
jgi:hypothetical protein